MTISSIDSDRETSNEENPLTNHVSTTSSMFKFYILPIRFLPICFFIYLAYLCSMVQNIRSLIRSQKALRLLSTIFIVIKVSDDDSGFLLTKGNRTARTVKA